MKDEEKKTNKIEKKELKEKWKVTPDISRFTPEAQKTLQVHIENLKKRGGGETLHGTAGLIAVKELK